MSPTDGPWRVFRADHKKGFDIMRVPVESPEARGTVKIATVTYGSSPHVLPKALAIANARVLAAGPELISVLVAAHHFLIKREGMEDDSELRDLLSRIQWVLTQASIGNEPL